jgi:thiamine-monophosphate kinase
MLSEFALIERYFAHSAVQRGDVALGVGDDAALLRVPPGVELAATVDTLIEGVHFLPGADPESLGHKALAVNLSDLAAMGAEPAWVSLALTLPGADERWLEGFARGFHALAGAHGVQLVGGDTTRGALSISVQAFGFVPAGEALRRSAARPGDLIYVTGTLGDAGLGLEAALGRLAAGSEQAAWLVGRLNRPTPRIAAGLALRGIAHAAIDISDGLRADLGHILAASGVGATVHVERLPLSPAFIALAGGEAGWEVALSAGDDYELCFTVPVAREAQLARALADFGCACTRIGVIEEQPGLRLLRASGSAFVPEAGGGYEHFRLQSDG